MATVGDPAAAADRKRNFLLTSLSAHRPADQPQHASNATRWPESLHDRVVRLRIEVTDIFKRALAEAEGPSQAEGAATSPVSEHPLCSSLSSSAMDPNDAQPLSTWQHRKLLALIEGDVLQGVQRLAEELPRGVYQESVHARMRAEFQERSHAMSAQKEQLLQQQQQLYNARRLHHSHGADASGSGAATGGGDDATPNSPLSINSPARPSSPMAASRRHHTSGGGSTRPASAGAAADVAHEETFADAHLRHLYTQLHEAKAEVQQERVRVDALKAFCLRKDAAVDYIRETLLHEVVVLKEQLRRQEQDPNFVSDFVTLFDCWKVLEGDDPGGNAGGAGGVSEAVRQAKKELQAEMTRAQQQFQLVLRKKDDDIANLQGKLNDATQGASPLERKKSGKGKKLSDDFHEQFLQLTGDMAKKDVCIADLTEELKQLQTEVAIAQQLAKSTRDQLNRSNVDIESAVSIRDTEILAKCELIEALEAENTKLRQLVSDDEVKRRQGALDGAMQEVAVVTSRAHELQHQTEMLQQETTQLRRTIQSKNEEVERLQDMCKLSSDERTAVLERRVLDLEAVVAAKDAEVKKVEYTVQSLETELDRVASNYETVKFEHTKLRSAMRSGASAGASVTPSQEHAPDESLLQADAPETIAVLHTAEDNEGGVSPGRAPQADAGDAAPTTDATWALERRLAKEMASTKRLQVENEALREDMQAMKGQLAAALSATANNSMLAAASSTSAPPTKSPRKRSSSKGSKSDPSAGQQRSPSTATLAGAMGSVDDECHQTALAAKDNEIEALRTELDTLRQQQADAAAASIVEKTSAVTFAFHVAPDASPPQASSPRHVVQEHAPLEDVPNITIDALRPATKTVGGGGRPTATKKPSPTAKQHQGPPAAAASMPRNRTHGQRDDNDVSPFEATLQECGDTMAPGGWDAPTFGHLRSGASVSPPMSDDHGGEVNQRSFSEVASVSDGVYHRALQGGGGETTPTEETVPTRVRLLEATLGEREAQLHTALLQIAMLNSEVQVLKANEAKHAAAIAAAGRSPPPSTVVAHRIKSTSPGASSPLSTPTSASMATVGDDVAAACDSQGGRSLPSHATTQRSVVEAAATNAAVGIDADVCTLMRQESKADDVFATSEVHTTHAASHTVRGASAAAGCHDGCTSVAVQTDLAMAAMRALLHAAPTTMGGGATRSTPPLSNPPSRQGSANHRTPSSAGGAYSGAAAVEMDDEATNVPTTGNPTHRIFSAHRRAVHAAGTPASVHQTSGRVPTESMFYIAGDGEVVHGGGSGGEPLGSSMDDPTANNGLPAGRVLRQARPTGSAASQRGGSVGDKLNSAVAVAKGLCDSTKARTGSLQRPGSAAAAGDDHHALDLQQLVARPSSSATAKRSASPSVLQQVHRPMAPAVLQGLSESVQSLAKTHLGLHPLRMSPHPQQPSDATAAATSEERQDHQYEVMNPPPAAATTTELVAGGGGEPPQLPNTVDCREHVSQVIFGVGEQGALRGVKEKIKQNVNVEKFLSKVLTVRR